MKYTQLRCSDGRFREMSVTFVSIRKSWLLYLIMVLHLKGVFPVGYVLELISLWRLNANDN